jgi:hypothetical protein
MEYAVYIIAAALVGAFLFRRRLLRAASIDSNTPEQRLAKVRIIANFSVSALKIGEWPKLRKLQR